MSDMLEKLLSVEKRAAALVADAEAEAHRRAAQARADVQHRHMEALTSRAAEAEKAVAAERERSPQSVPGRTRRTAKSSSGVSPTRRHSPVWPRS